MTIIKVRSGSNQPGDEVSHLKKSTVKWMVKRSTSYQRLNMISFPTLWEKCLPILLESACAIDPKQTDSQTTS